jgi:class 3 adenylate cyclase
MTAQPLDTRISGTAWTRFLLELFGNSAQFPIANVMLEMLLEGPAAYLLAPDLYIILLAGTAQAYWLSRWQITSHPRRFVGNLIGPVLYTLIESLLEGWRFFSAPHHLAYWGFALLIGLLQAGRLRWPGWFSAVLVIFENVVRASILLIMYIIFESLSNPQQTTSAAAFFSDASHQFVSLVTLLLGLSLGLANLTTDRYLDLLRQTSAQLKTYSEWLLGRDLLSKLIQNPTALNLKREERTALFMDIRGFTRWCDSRPPEDVIQMLNDYYAVIEETVNRHSVIKYKFSADEVMAVFTTVADGVSAARALRLTSQRLLAAHGLGAGIGVHTGPLIEGLLGSAGVKFYDVIGDTVNTAKRIESATAANEILISHATRLSLGAAILAGAERQIAAKGKEGLLVVYSLDV